MSGGQWLLEPVDAISALWEPRPTCSDKVMVTLKTHHGEAGCEQRDNQTTKGKAGEHLIGPGSQGNFLSFQSKEPVGMQAQPPLPAPRC